MRTPFTLGDALRILVICLVVGFIIKALGFGPVEFWLAIRDALDWIWRHSAELLRNVAEYILIGAAIVVPILVVRYAWRSLKRR
jgi:hypothetical protein